MTNSITSKSYIAFDTLQGVIVDMDGVLWRGDQILPGVSDFFNHLTIPYVFATNNSSRTVDYYVKKINKLGVPVTPEQIISSGTATAAYLATHYPAGTRLFVVGEDGLKSILQGERLTVVDETVDPDVVVVGIDRFVTYDKLKHAAMSIRKGAAFIATNPDKTFPVPDGLAPGAGTLMAAVQVASDVEPTIIGKPARPMFEVALQRLGTAPHHTLMIGDRLETDVAGARASDLQSVLLLSGVSTLDDLAKSLIQPDGVYADLAALLEAI